jgi:sarcosine oxidase
MRAIIVGGGVVGLSTAWQLRRKGCEVVLLERFRLGHSRGSSHGETRMTRSAYPDHLWVELVNQANHEDWPRLEREGGVTLVHRRRGCFFGPRSGAITHIAAAMMTAGVDVDCLDASEATHAFPALRFTEDDLIVDDHSAGVILAAETMRTLAHLCVSEGVEIREEVQVTSWQASPRRVVANGETLEADLLVLAPGPFARELLPEAPLRATRQHVAYYDVPAGDHMPVWASFEDEMHYGLPDMGNGAKVGLHGTSGTDDPNEVQEPDEAALRKVDDFVRRRFASEPKRVRAEACFYTMTPDEDFVMDTLAKGVVVGAGLSGHGFKFAPLIGRILSELALDGRSHVTAFERNRARFRMKR